MVDVKCSNSYVKWLMSPFLLFLYSSVQKSLDEAEQLVPWLGRRSGRERAEKSTAVSDSGEVRRTPGSRWGVCVAGGREWGAAETGMLFWQGRKLHELFVGDMGVNF